MKRGYFLMRAFIGDCDSGYVLELGAGSHTPLAPDTLAVILGE
jgi:hypothetical protein